MGQSTGASNRIENISTSNKRLRELMLEKAEPKNRDEREIAGYRCVLDLIHESHGGIPDPFNDGNGRMSRLLTLLLMYRSGYDVGKYVSIEKEIERTKETYYEALAVSSQGWREGKSDYVPFVTYMLGIIDACCRELANRFPLVGAPADNEEAIRAFFDRLIGSATKREIMDANPGMSQRTLERILSKLQQEGVIEKIGAARSTAYRRCRGATKREKHR